MRFDPSIFNTEPTAPAQDTSPTLDQFRGLELAQGIEPLTWGIAQAIAKGSEFKIAEQDLNTAALRGVPPEDRLRELYDTKAQLQRRLQSQGFQPQDLSLMGQVPPSAQLTGVLPTPPANGLETPGTGNSTRDQLIAQQQQMQKDRAGLKFEPVDLSGITGLQGQVQTALGEQPKAPQMVQPQLEDWQKVALGVAALFGGGQTLQAVSEGIRQGVITRADIENQANQADFANKFETWRGKVGGLNNLLDAEVTRVNQAERGAINKFNAEDRRLAQGIDDVQRQIENMDRNEREATKLEFQKAKFDEQTAQSYRKIATQQQGQIFDMIRESAPEARRAFYQELRRISGENSVWAMMSDEQLNAVANAKTPRQIQLETQQKESQARIKSLAARDKLTEAQAAKIIEETKWIPEEYQSRIETRKSQIELGRGRLNVSLESLKERISRNQLKEARAERNVIEKDLKAQLSLLNEEESIYKAILSQTEDVNSPEFIQASASMQRVNRDRQALVKSLQELRGMKIEEPQATQGENPSSVMGSVAGDIANTVGGMGLGAGALNDPRANSAKGPNVRGVPPGGLPAPQDGSKTATSAGKKATPKKTSSKPKTLKTKAGFGYRVKGQ